MHLRNLLLTASALCFLSPALAQETAPGDACSAGETNYIKQVGGPETSGVVHLMRCDGANWIQYITFLSDGSVGIGAANPQSELHVNEEILVGQSGTTGEIAFKQSNGTTVARVGSGVVANTSILGIFGYSGIQFDAFGPSVNFKTSGESIWDVYSGSNFSFNGYTGFGGEVVMKNRQDGTEVFHAYLTSPYRVTFPNGNVGIGTTSPAATIDVNGFARLATNSAAPATCAAGTAGSIALTSTHRMCVCDGTSWNEVNSAIACTW